MEMHANAIITDIPAIHPSWAMAHARASTPAPITTVTMCVVAVNTFPATNHVNPRKFFFSAYSGQVKQ